jgi:hypothetical protein
MSKTSTLAFRPGRYQFTSTDSGRRYVLTIGSVQSPNVLDFIKCSCRGFKGAGHCKHVEDVELFGVLPDSAVGVNAVNSTTNNKGEKKMSTTTRKVVVRRSTKTAKVESTTPRRRRTHNFPLDVAVNVKVAGERAMRKNVVLVQHPTDNTLLRVLTGSRGRPSHLAITDIEKVRAL